MAKKLLPSWMGAHTRVHMHFLHRVGMYLQVLLHTIHVQVCTLDRCCEHQRTFLLHARYRMCICDRYRDTYTYMCICIYIYIYMYMYIYMRMYMYRYPCIYVCVCVCTWNIYMCMHVNMCMCACIYVYVYVYTRVHMHFCGESACIHRCCWAPCMCRCVR